MRTVSTRLEEKQGNRDIAHKGHLTFEMTIMNLNKKGLERVNVEARMEKKMVKEEAEEERDHNNVVHRYEG